MPQSNVSALIAAHLGLPVHAVGLVATRTFRSITVTSHRLRAGNWSWAPRQTTQPSVAVLFFDAPDQPSEGDNRLGVYLPHHAQRSVTWQTDVGVLAVWIPERLLREFTEGEVPDTVDLVSTPLTLGFRDFARSVVRHSDEGSSMSRYAIERLLAEMTFGSLLEQTSAEQGTRQASLVDRARSVMLMRREDPQFSTPQLAAELHISQRQLQRAFSQAGLTPGDMLRRMRVDLAESMLRNPLYSGLTVDEVSRYAGFTSALQLRRALQAEGAPSPTTLRRTAQ